LDLQRAKELELVPELRDELLEEDELWRLDFLDFLLLLLRLRFFLEDFFFFFFFWEPWCSSISDLRLLITSASFCNSKASGCVCLWQVRMGVQLVADGFRQRLGHMTPTSECRSLLPSKLRHQGIDCIFELATWHALYLATTEPWSL